MVSQNPGKFRSVTQLGMSGPSDGFNHSVHNSASHVGDDSTFPVSFVRASSQHKSELNTQDLLLTENTLSRREVRTPFLETSNMLLQENVRLFYTKLISTCMSLYFLFCLHKFVIVMNEYT